MPILLLLQVQEELAQIQLKPLLNGEFHFYTIQNLHLLKEGIDGLGEQGRQKHPNFLVHVLWVKYLR